VRCYSAGNNHVFFGVQADLKKCNEECSGDKVALKIGDKNVSASPCGMYGSVFNNHVVRRRGGEEGFRDHLIRNRRTEQVYSDHGGKKFCSCDLDGRGNDEKSVAPTMYICMV
jgi:hypothetical protein